MNRFLVYLIILIGTQAQASSLTVPDLEEGESRIYRTYYSDPDYDPRDQSGSQILMQREAPQWYQVETEWAGEGDKRHVVYKRSELLFSGATGKWTFEFAPGRELALDRFEHTVTTPGGTTLFREINRMREPTLGYPDTLFQAFSLGFALRGMDMAEGRVQKLWLWVSPLIIYEMEIEVVGKEVIQLEIGERECWKLEMRTSPDNFPGATGLIMQRVTPVINFWMIDDESRVMARYEGSVGLVEGLGSTKLINDLCFYRSAKYPDGIGKKPAARPPTPAPTLTSGPPFKTPELSGEDLHQYKVYTEKPITDLKTLPLNQQLMYLEAANFTEKRLFWVGEGPDRRLRFTRNGTLNNKCYCRTEFNFAPGEHLLLKNMKRVYTAPSDVVVRDEYVVFDDPFLNHPQDLCHPWTIEIAYRSMDHTPGVSRNFNLWMGPGMILKMKTEVGDLETMTLYDGRKVEGLIIQPIVPRYTWWIEEKGHHSLIRYRGPLGQVSFLGAPVEVHDILPYRRSGQPFKNDP
jgi:hypothetical protein